MRTGIVLSIKLTVKEAPLSWYGVFTPFWICLSFFLVVDEGWPKFEHQFTTDEYYEYPYQASTLSFTTVVTLRVHGNNRGMFNMKNIDILIDILKRFRILSIYICFS